MSQSDQRYRNLLLHLASLKIMLCCTPAGSHVTSPQAGDIDSISALCLPQLGHRLTLSAEPPGDHDPQSAASSGT